VQGAGFLFQLPIRPRDAVLDEMLQLMKRTDIDPLQRQRYGGRRPVTPDASFPASPAARHDGS
jgi:hypothetical protein